MSIIGILVGLLMPAVQYAREAARRSECSNHLRQLGMGLHQFHAVHNQFPPGNDDREHLNHSWVTHILPHLEQTSIFQLYDFKKPWSDPANAQATLSVIPIMRCPSGMKSFDGDTDYAGIEGSSLSGLPWGRTPGSAWSAGMLFQVGEHYADVVTFGQVPDGTSQTVMVAEATDGKMGYWASGFNCIPHENGPISSDFQSGIRSGHSGIAFATFADGSVQTLTRDMDLYVLGSLCTRNGGEVIRW